MDDDKYHGLKEDQLIGQDEMTLLIKESADQAIGQNGFLHSKIDTWTQNVVESVLKR